MSSHNHTHHHDHSHEHIHSETQSEMSFKEKINKLIEHWIKHNDDHASTYREWADRAQAEGLDDVAAAMIAAAEKNIVINREFKQALEMLKK